MSLYIIYAHVTHGSAKISIAFSLPGCGCISGFRAHSITFIMILAWFGKAVLRNNGGTIPPRPFRTHLQGNRLHGQRRRTAGDHYLRGRRRSMAETPRSGALKEPGGKKLPRQTPFWGGKTLPPLCVGREIVFTINRCPGEASGKAMAGFPPMALHRLMTTPQSRGL